MKQLILEERVDVRTPFACHFSKAAQRNPSSRLEQVWRLLACLSVDGVHMSAEQDLKCTFPTGHGALGCGGFGWVGLLSDI